MSNGQPASDASAARARATLALAATALLAAALVAGELAAGMFRPWNDARLAPSAALLHGHALYAAPAETAPIWSWIYGPIAPLVYLPAVLLPTPAGALAIALAMTATIYLGAARLLLLRATAARGPWFEASFAALVLYSLAEPALRGAAFWVHADGPAIGLATLACASIATPERRERPAPLALGALASVLAVATKQVLLPLPLALLAAVAWTSGRRAGIRWLAWTAAWSLATAALFVSAFGLDALVFNLVTIPLAHPWQWGGGAGALARAGGELALHALPLLGLAALASLRGAATPGAEARSQPRGLLLCVAVALSFAGVLTRVKLGAGPNAHAFALFFLAVVVAGATADACARPSQSRPARAGLLLAIAACLALTAPALARLPGLLRALPDNPQTTGVVLAREAPGTLYFPSHPLVTLYAEGRASHVSYGIYDRELAGYRVSDEQFRAFTAPRLERVVLWAARDDHALRRLPALSRREPVGPQPGWILVGADGAGATAAPTRQRPADGPARESALPAHSRP
jgi:hypothetical protein